MPLYRFDLVLILLPLFASFLVCKIFSAAFLSLLIVWNILSETTLSSHDRQTSLAHKTRPALLPGLPQVNPLVRDPRRPPHDVVGLGELLLGPGLTSGPAARCFLRPCSACPLPPCQGLARPVPALASLPCRRVGRAGQVELL